MIYQFVFRDLTGASVAFSQFKGKVLLIVNTASACGLTPQYKELEELYEKYKSQGFEVIAFPCNQFAHQEPGSSEDILHFVREKYGVTFPVMEKSDVEVQHCFSVGQWALDKRVIRLFEEVVSWVSRRVAFLCFFSNVAT